ncbi:hypothetical protein SLA2020_499070 [Shorea laevis]
MRWNLVHSVTDISLPGPTFVSNSNVSNVTLTWHTPIRHCLTTTVLPQFSATPAPVSNVGPIDVNFGDVSVTELT